MNELIGKTIKSIFEDNGDIYCIAFTDGTCLEVYNLSISDFVPVKLPSAQILAFYTGDYARWCVENGLLEEGQYEAAIEELQHKNNLKRLEAERVKEENDFANYQRLKLKYETKPL